jgi:hypothetical protein
MHVINNSTRVMLLKEVWVAFNYDIKYRYLKFLLCVILFYHIPLYRYE